MKSRKTKVVARSQEATSHSKFSLEILHKSLLAQRPNSIKVYKVKTQNQESKELVGSAFNPPMFL